MAAAEQNPIVKTAADAWDRKVRDRGGNVGMDARRPCQRHVSAYGKSSSRFPTPAVRPK